jgi:hypothetical protein
VNSGPAQSRIPFRQRLGYERRVLMNRLRCRLVPFRIRRIKSAPCPTLIDNSLTVVCMVRNGRCLVDLFCRHYLQLGAAQIIILDNGSSDGTLDAAGRYENVTLLSTDAPYATWQAPLKAWLAEAHAGPGWALIADIDELLRWPCDDVVRLPDFLSFLNREGASAVLTQMLDLFAAAPLDSWPDNSADLQRDCVWYDNSALIRRPIAPTRFNQNARYLDPGSEYFYGGIRLKAFGVNSMLTKHSLFRPARGSRLHRWDVHYCTPASVSAVTAALLHYRFTAEFRANLAEMVARSDTKGNRADYVRAGAKVDCLGPSGLFTDASCRFESTAQLLDQSFLNSPPRFLECAGKTLQSRPRHPASGAELQTSLLS